MIYITIRALQEGCEQVIHQCSRPRMMGDGVEGSGGPNARILRSREQQCNSERNLEDGKGTECNENVRPCCDLNDNEM